MRKMKVSKLSLVLSVFALLLTLFTGISFAAENNIFVLGDPNDHVKMGDYQNERLGSLKTWIYKPSIERKTGTHYIRVETYNIYKENPKFKYQKSQYLLDFSKLKFQFVGYAKYDKKGQLIEEHNWENTTTPEWNEFQDDYSKELASNTRKILQGREDTAYAAFGIERDYEKIGVMGTGNGVPYSLYKPSVEGRKHYNMTYIVAWVRFNHPDKTEYSVYAVDPESNRYQIVKEVNYNLRGERTGNQDWGFSPEKYEECIPDTVAEEVCKAVRGKYNSIGNKIKRFF